jgi:hypothetical protein
MPSFHTPPPVQGAIAWVSPPPSGIQSHVKSLRSSYAGLCDFARGCILDPPYTPPASHLRANHQDNHPHGGVPPFHQESTRLTQTILGPYAAQIWSRYRGFPGGRNPRTPLCGSGYSRIRTRTVLGSCSRELMTTLGAVRVLMRAWTVLGSYGREPRTNLGAVRVLVREQALQILCTVRCCEAPCFFFFFFCIYSKPEDQ